MLYKMTKERLSQARRSLARLRDQLPALLEVFLQARPMLKAYLDSKPRTCGTPGCRCARGEKHPAWVVRIPQGRTARSRSVSEATFERLEPLTEEYRRFRQTAAQWRRLLREADQAIRVIEEERCLDPEVELEKADGK